MALALAFSSSKTPTPPTRDLEDAVNDFQGILSSEQRAELQKLRAVPDAGAVLSFTAQLDKSSASQKCPNKGTRLIPVLQFVRESAAVIDTFVSSHPEIAALVWGSVKLTMQCRTYLCSLLKIAPVSPNTRPCFQARPDCKRLSAISTLP
ncbi:hypothetical protein LX36DRAFT_382444 [Colletotrichum falcatum]|nr:hypothetical protein LX36DRAFT_382444 [Colletotrichum falcatum]